MNKKVLLLHIGTAKTGTTAIQEFLRLNQDMLNTQGWNYPDLYRELYGRPDEKEITTHAALSNGMILYDVMKYQGRLNMYGILWRHIKKSLKKYNTIISCETMFDNFDGMSLYERLTLYKRKYSNIKVVVYLRRQDLWIESAWNQAVEGCSFFESIQNFTEKYPRACDSPNYLLKIQEIERALGRENLIIRVYEKGQFSGERKDSISDFAYVLETLGCEINIYSATIPEHTNPRLTDEALSFALLFGERFRQYSCKFCKELQELFCKINEFTISQGNLAGGYFSKEERESIMEKYKEGNEVIAKEYLGRNDGKLFYDENTDYQMWNQREFGDEEKKQLLIIAEQMAKLANRTNEKGNRRPLFLRYFDQIKILIRGI